MKENILVVISIIVLFTTTFLLGNGAYFKDGQKQPSVEGIVKINEKQLQSITKLDGEWAFYPNRLIQPGQPLQQFEDERLVVKAPGNIANSLQPNEEGISVGTYHLMIKVPQDGYYGLYIQALRQANRVYINGVEVASKGNVTTSREEFEVENADRYIAVAQSDNQLLDILVHVGNRSYPQVGILYSVEFGTAQKIQHFYLFKLLLNAFVVSGYIVLGMIYTFSYIQNSRQKSELFFGLFAILLGLYMSFVNNKLFFLLTQIEEVGIQIRLQLGILPLILLCFTLFIHNMYPYLSNKRMIQGISVLLVGLFILYGIYNPFKGEFVTPNQLLTSQVVYVMLLLPVLLYNVANLIRVLFLKLEEIKYILMIFISICCYALLLVLNFLIDLPFESSELVLFSVILVAFILLLNFRANAAFLKIENLSAELIMHNQMKNKFLLKTSYELRTPLNGILNLSKALMEGTKGLLKRQQQEHVILIHNITKRLGYLVEDLLFSSQQMNGEIKLAPAAVPITVIQDVIEEIRSVWPTDGQVKLIMNVDEALPMMWTDELRFKQVLYNLLNNAVQHTKEGEITITAAVIQNRMEINVSDTGTGISKQDLEWVFNAFYRVEKQANKKGLGLGLSISKNLVEKLNGEIFVKSTLGEGTTFTFTMPIAMEVQPVNEPALQMMTNCVQAAVQLDLPFMHKGNEKRILIVDDNHMNIKVLCDACVARGYSVIAVDNGFDALQMIQKHQIDCLLTDLLMEGMSGYELCEQVRKQFDLLELPIIVLTAIMNQSDLLLTLKLGGNDYLQKPVDMEELFIRIESLLAIRQSSIEAVEAEMNYLYVQITPHFVYNTLNTIIALSYTSPEDTREALYCLTTYFRAKLNTHYRQNMMVPLEEEIELVKAYLYIEKLRFEDRLSIQYDIDETIDVMIPPLSLQPLVENAIAHGISKKIEGGTITITVKRVQQFIYIEIADNGVGMTDEKRQQLMEQASTRIGFINPYKKFELMKNVSFELDSKENTGTMIRIILPGVEKYEYSNH